MSFSIRLTLWYALMFVVASAAWLYAVYYLMDQSIDKEWRVTRSRIVSSWSGVGVYEQGEVEITGQRAVIEGSVPIDLDVSSHFRQAFYRIALPILVAGLLGGWLVAHRGLRPLRNLGLTVRHILSTGSTQARVPVDSERGELNELVGLINRMLDQNHRLMQGMHESLDNVAHDLRTPMTRMRSSAEVALQDVDRPEACREALEDCMEESDRVLTMLNALMDVAEAETGAMSLHLETVSAARVVANVVDLYELVAEEREIEVTTEVPDDMAVRADRTRLRQVLANLLDNAIKYSDPGGRVTIFAECHADRVRISVRDQGQGIPSDEQDRIWDRLYRGDLSRTQRGLGLGLSTVRAITEAHGGSVGVESAAGTGSTFTLSWPGASG